MPRKERRELLLERLWADLRFAARILRKSPAFTVTAVLSLALGIGANTAIFGLLDAVLLRELPVRAPAELVLLTERVGDRQNTSFTWEQYRTMKMADTLAGLSAFRPWNGFRVTRQGESQLANGQMVSGDYFALLGVAATLGRTLTAEDDQTARPVAVLSHQYWRTQFAADRGAVGRYLTIQGQPFLIVGVAPPEFFGLEPGKSFDITIPLSLQPVVMPGTPLLGSPNARWLRLIGRRKREFTLPQAQANLASLWSRVLTGPSKDTRRLEVVSGAQGLYDLRQRFSLPLRLLMAGVALVLLVACANLASLLLARAASRRHEVEIRSALGAGRLRLLRQMLTETLLLAGAGGVLGICLARYGGQFLVDFMSRGRAPLILDLSLNLRTLAFTGLVSLITGLIFGIGPALRVTGAGFTSSVQGMRVAGGRAQCWTQALIVSQVALSLIVLVSAGLLLGSLRKLGQVDGGFRKDRILLMSIRPAISGYDGQRSARLYEELLRRFQTLPGVESATLSMDVPLGGSNWTTGASPTGRPADSTLVQVNSVGPRYFETFGIPLRHGRKFGARDDAHQAPLAVISASAAARLFPGRDPVGQHVTVHRTSLEVVGVVGDTRYWSLREAPQPTIYRPYLQMPDTWEELFYGIRARGDSEVLAGLVRRELHEAAPSVPVYSLHTLASQVDASLVQERLLSSLSAMMGALALLLASIGLYGRLSYAVVERTREIGVRLALGAEPFGIVRMILREVLLLVAAGIAIGLPLALAAARSLTRLLYGVEPNDPRTLVPVIAITLAVTAIAGYLPARRAARVDPMQALRAG